VRRLLHGGTPSSSIGRNMTGQAAAWKALEGWSW